MASLGARTGAGGGRAGLGPRVPGLGPSPASDVLCAASSTSLPVCSTRSPRLCQAPGNRMQLFCDMFWTLAPSSQRNLCPMDTGVIVLNIIVPKYGESGAQRCPVCRGVSPSHFHHPCPLGDPPRRYPMTFWLLSPRSLVEPSGSLLLKGSRASCLLLLPQDPRHPSLAFSAISPSCTPFLNAGLLRTHSWHFPCELDGLTDLPA